jgi:acyl-CoA thioesterase FadM
MHDEFPRAFSQTFRVRYDECGPGGWMRASAHLRACQEIAFAHSEAVGFALAWYEQHRFFWILRRIRFATHHAARYGHALTYTTRVLGARRVFARRKTTARRESDGVTVATCIADWIFTREGAAINRIDEGLARAFPSFAEPITPMPLEEVAAPADAARRTLTFRTTDLDDMRHANHTAYVDVLDDAIARADGVGSGAETSDARTRTYDLLYHSAATADDVLVDRTWRAECTWHYRLERSDGALLLHGRVTPGDSAIDDL